MPPGSTVSTPRPVERRRASRARPGPLRVRLHPSGAGMLIDVSISGMLVRIDTPTTSGALLVLDLEWDGTVIQLRGRVVRVVPARSGERMVWAETSDYDTALQFEPLSGETSATLHELIARAGGA